MNKRIRLEVAKDEVAEIERVFRLAISSMALSEKVTQRLTAWAVKLHMHYKNAPDDDDQLTFWNIKE